MRKLLMVLPALMLLSCGSEKVILRPEGSMAQIILKDQRKQTAELLALNDKFLICLADTLLEIPVDDIAGLKLTIDESRGWIVPVMFLQALPSVILISAVDDDEKWIGALGLGITALTWASFELSGPRVSFDRPWKEKDIEELRLHMRYLQKLTDDQLMQLRTSSSVKK